MLLLIFFSLSRLSELGNTSKPIPLKFGRMGFALLYCLLLVVGGVLLDVYFYEYFDGNEQYGFDSNMESG